MDQKFSLARTASLCLGQRQCLPVLLGGVICSCLLPRRSKLRAVPGDVTLAASLKMLLFHFKWKGRNHFTAFPVGSEFCRYIQWVPVCQAGEFLESLSERDRGNQALGRLPSDHGQRKGHTQEGWYASGLLHELAQVLMV